METKLSNSKQYNLEERTYLFAESIRKFVKELPKTIQNIEDVKQLIRSSGSIAANYIEANESLSKKDFVMRIKICKKEAKETRLWLRLIYINNASLENKRMEFISEVIELMKIFGAIIEKSK